MHIALNFPDGVPSVNPAAVQPHLNPPAWEQLSRTRGAFEPNALFFFFFSECPRKRKWNSRRNRDITRRRGRTIGQPENKRSYEKDNAVVHTHDAHSSIPDERGTKREKKARKAARTALFYESCSSACALLFEQSNARLEGHAALSGFFPRAAVVTLTIRRRLLARTDSTTHLRRAELRARDPNALLLHEIRRANYRIRL